LTLLGRHLALKVLPKQFLLDPRAKQRFDLLRQPASGPGIGADSLAGRCIGGVIDWSDMLRRYLLVTPDTTMILNWNHLAPVERAEKLTGAWDGVWFEEDYCEGS
jgi:hypothetical protein